MVFPRIFSVLVLVLHGVLCTEAQAVRAYAAPRPEFTAVLSAVTVPGVAQRLGARSAGLERLKGWCHRLLEGSNGQQENTVAPARTIEEAVTLIDAYATRLIAAYPAELRGELGAMYFQHAGLRTWDEVTDAREMVGFFSPLEDPSAFHVEENVMRRTRIYSRTILIHEALVHRAQWLELVHAQGEDGARAAVGAYLRVSELTAHLVERDLAVLIPRALLEKDTEDLPFSDETFSFLKQRWARKAEDSEEESLQWVFQNYCKVPPGFWEGGLHRWSLMRVAMEHRLDHLTAMRPDAEIAAVLARWRRSMKLTR